MLPVERSIELLLIIDLRQLIPSRILALPLSVKDLVSLCALMVGRHIGTVHLVCLSPNNTLSSHVRKVQTQGPGSLEQEHSSPF